MTTTQADLYREAGRMLAPAIARLARAVEADADKARDLEQDIHCALWRSFARFDGRCAVKTWVYRVAHNVAAEHALRENRRRRRTVPLEEIEDLPLSHDSETAHAEAIALEQARALVRTLPTLDAQVVLLWLEGESGQAIGEVTGLSPAAVATRIHRIQKLLAAQFAAPSEETDR